jgi:hypothetical protein
MIGTSVIIGKQTTRETPNLVDKRRIAAFDLVGSDSAIKIRKLDNESL